MQDFFVYVVPLTKLESIDFITFCFWNFVFANLIRGSRPQRRNVVPWICAPIGVEKPVLEERRGQEMVAGKAEEGQLSFRHVASRVTGSSPKFGIR